MPNPFGKPKKPDWHIRGSIAFVVVFVGMIIYLQATDKPVKKKQACECISVTCDCVPGLCRCGGIKTCTESCYEEAKRQGRVK